MSVSHDAAEDRSASVDQPIKPTVPWRVHSVQSLPDFRLRVRFIDGLEGFVEMKELIHSPTAGVFASLRDPSVFAQVHVEFGTVTWPGELDLAPDAMHDEIKANGKWVLE